MSQNQEEESSQVYSLLSDGTIQSREVNFPQTRPFQAGNCRQTVLRTFAWDHSVTIETSFDGIQYQTDAEGIPLLFTVSLKEPVAGAGNGFVYPCKTQAEAEALHAGILLHLLEKKHKVKPIRPEDLNKPDGLRRVLKR